MKHFFGYAAVENMAPRKRIDKALILSVLHFDNAFDRTWLTSQWSEDVYGSERMAACSYDWCNLTLTVSKGYTNISCKNMAESSAVAAAAVMEA